jgi:hypothetical protein
VNINRRNSFSTSSVAASSILYALPARPLLVFDRFTQPRPQVVLSISPVQLALAERHVLLLATAATVCTSSAEHVTAVLQPQEQTEACEQETTDVQPAVDSSSVQQQPDANGADGNDSSGDAAAATVEIPEVPAVIALLLIASASVTLITGDNSAQKQVNTS